MAVRVLERDQVRRRWRQYSPGTIRQRTFRQ